MGSEIILILLIALFVMILLRFQIGIVLGLISGLGVYLIIGNAQAALSIISSIAYDAVRNQIFAVIPLFVLMGDIVAKSGAATDLYRLCDRGLSRLPGRLSVATVTGSACLGMITDSVSIILLSMPIFAPMVVQTGFDPIAFAIFGILVIEAGLLTPPFGLLVYTV